MNFGQRPDRKDSCGVLPDAVVLSGTKRWSWRKSVWFDEDSMWVRLNDARVIGVPLTWFPRLLNATKKELEQYELSAFGIHWEHLDEDISVEGLLAGQGDLSTAPTKVA
ncbi:hypothetical protein B5F76_11565 [Desulfovibrio sp. An276]|uniref:DUF2442 domain-containing protein n=1 Tax=Desulfovibrio sp. An276 TaxID=1965618 RepID=UPI000B39E9F6|nr:DUF2442 domain-containing protein [Desulfovibrio sp. An276]OUO50473.1 hypothetical protein B5F76_11565 [Desulfovibrio sp. An276]